METHAVPHLHPPMLWFPSQGAQCSLAKHAGGGLPYDQATFPHLQVQQTLRLPTTACRCSRMQPEK